MRKADKRFRNGKEDSVSFVVACWKDSSENSHMAAQWRMVRLLYCVTLRMRGIGQVDRIALGRPAAA